MVHRIQTLDEKGPSVAVSDHGEMNLDSMSDYPMLHLCHQAWLSASNGGALPATLDMDLLPDNVLPYTMIIEFWPEKKDAFVKSVGSFIGERALFAAESNTLQGFFNPADAQTVFGSLVRCAVSQKPSLARRSCIMIDGENLSYVRLILPLSLDRRVVTGFVKTIEPSTLVSDPV
jgi:hypothetical protein